MDTKYNLNMEFLDSATTVLSSILAVLKQQVMSPGATTMVKFDGKNYRKWAMYMEALSVQKNLWDIVSGTGLYDVTNLEDVCVVVKKNSYAYLDFVLTLGDYEPGFMEERYKESSLTRQLKLVNKLFTWKCKKSENPDKWVQEWCDVLKEFLNMQTDKEDFWKEYGGAITSLGSISDIPIRLIGTKLGERLWGLKGQNAGKAHSRETAYGINNDKRKETRTCYTWSRLLTARDRGPVDLRRNNHSDRLTRFRSSARVFLCNELVFIGLFEKFSLVVEARTGTQE
ncbi:hypothetical protein V1504DRAFT_471924 [Lipomyces starkeyi]